MSEANTYEKRYYTIIYPGDKKSEKVEFTTTTVDVDTINKIVGHDYELIPTKSAEYVIAVNGLIFMGSPGEADHLPFNKKASKKADRDYDDVVGNVVYIKLAYLEFIAGNKRQLMQEYLKDYHPNGERKI